MPITEGGRFTPNDRIVSPGVFSRENDLSGIAQGVADIGGVVVAPFAKGPGFSPTVCKSVSELENKFGLADGTLYGPYTAKQYLQEKGFVTVVRVGALTGYHQKYPFIIWAEYGSYARALDAGWVNPVLSYIGASNLLFSATYSASFNRVEQLLLLQNHTTTSYTGSYIGWSYSPAIPIYQTSSITYGPETEHTQSQYWAYYDIVDYTGSIPIINQPVTLSMMQGGSNVTDTSLQYGWTGNPGSNLIISHPNAGFTIIEGVIDAITGSIPNSGSTLYNGTTINGYINGNFPFQGLLNVSTLSASSESLTNAILNQHLFVGPIADVIFTSSQYPFETAVLTDVFISQSNRPCGKVITNIFGLLGGNFGTYIEPFTPASTHTYDECSLTPWTSNGPAYKVLAVLADTQFAQPNTNLEAPGFLGSTQSDTTFNGNTVDLAYNLNLSQSLDGGYGVYRYSLDTSDPQYITNVFGNDPRAGSLKNYAAGTKKEAAYLYKVFEDDIAVVASDPIHWKIHGGVMPSASWTGESINFTDQYSLKLSDGDSAYGLTNAYTPWVLSQKISAWNGGDATRFPLFQLWTLSDGTYTNTSYKIEISNVKLAGTVAGNDWGTFTLTIREYSDTDRKPKVLEQFNTLTLDPTSANFIARRIGDRYNYIRYDGKIIEFGTYDNLSKYIRVEITPNPYPITAVPYGFQAYSVPVNGAIGKWCNPIAYTKASIYGLFPGKYASGVDFGGAPSSADNELYALYPTSSNGQEHWRDNEQYFAPVPAGATIGENTVFALDDETTLNGVVTGSSATLVGTNAIPSTFIDSASELVYVKMRKFVFGFQGGFDGQSPSIVESLGGDITSGNTQGLDCTSITSAGSIAYKQCIAALGNADEFDINLIVTPGIVYSLHSYVTNLVVEMCETRGDCFYILDLYEDGGNPATSQIDQVVNLASEFDTSYAGAYYPWIKIKDTNTNQIVTVPPSVVMPAIYAANDRDAGEWWAAAGLNRGSIPQAVQVTDRTTHTERDTLYEGKVNPIAAFPGQGIVVWGQKTLQVKASALDRINVRRLLIEIKKFFASTARFLVFEQNTSDTRNKFLAVVNPYLEGIQNRSGLYAFKVVMDSSNNTPDLIDRNIMYGQIWLKPTRAAEFIIMDFNVMPTGASFPTA